MRRAKSALLSRKAIRLLRRHWLGTVGAILVVCVAVVVWFGWPREKTISDMLVETGYLENVPPSRFSGPGTINTVEFLSNGRVALHPTCDLKPNLLADKIQSSQTIDRELRQSIGKRLDVSGEMRDKLKGVAGANQISSIHLKLENANILLATDEALLFARRDLVKGTCEDAIIDNINAGGIVCQTRAVLEADVTYELKYNDEVSMSERARLSMAAAEKLNLNARQDSTDRISGRQLFFGIKLAPSAIILNSSSADRVPKCSILK